jgi:predicted SnoaL-like aldol condensation-catalyzing enzyme
MKSHFIDNLRGEENTPGMNTDNKGIVQRALAELITTGDVGALARFLSDDFVHHRPDSNRNKAEWLAAVRAVPLSDLRVEIQHVLADGAFVVMTSRRWLTGGGAGIVGVDIWRLENGLIVEGWETIEPVADAAARMDWWKRG